MYQAVINEAATQAPGDGALRALDWAELVARLSAARDLRALFAQPAVNGGGFAPETAAGIARSPKGERDVNLAALVSGKWADVTTAAAARPTGFGDRDN